MPSMGSIFFSCFEALDEMVVKTILLLTVIASIRCNRPTYSESIPPCLKRNVSFNIGHSLALKKMPGVNECQEWCQDVYQCSHFAFNPAILMCYLGQDHSEFPAPELMSGPKYCPRIDRSPSINGSLPVCQDNVCIVVSLS